MTKTIYHKEVFGSTTPAQMPSVPYRWGYIRAESGNAGSVFVGSSSDVAVMGSTDVNNKVGFELDAGQAMILDMLPLDEHPNLSDLWYVCENAGDDFTYYLVDW